MKRKRPKLYFTTKKKTSLFGGGKQAIHINNISEECLTKRILIR